MPIENCKLGKNVKIPHPELVNLYGCEIGDSCFIGPFVEIQSGVKIGDLTRIQSHTFICSKVRIGRCCFIAHGVVFINDRHPPKYSEEFWENTNIMDEVVIGSNATILPVKIGEKARIGAGAVVTKDVRSHATVAGNPAREKGFG